MEIDFIDTNESEKLADIYNKQIVGIPHCYKTNPDEFGSGFEHQKYSRHGYNEVIHSEKIIICRQKDEILGFADVAIADTELDGIKKQKGFIRFLTYKVGSRSAGQMLLSESEKYLTGFDINEIKAFRLLYVNDQCGYRFYHLNYGLISDKLGHICGLFGMNGYKIDGGEIFMDQPNYYIDEPVLPENGIEIIVKQKFGCGELPNFEVYAFRNGNRIGECESISVGEFSQAKNAQDWIFISGLWIEQNEQAKGWGRYLLHRNLWESQKVGYKNTAISTDWQNFRALLFYTNYDYYVTDTCYEFVKSLPT